MSIVQVTRRISKNHWQARSGEPGSDAQRVGGANDWTQGGNCDTYAKDNEMRRITMLSVGAIHIPHEPIIEDAKAKQSQKYPSLDERLFAPC